VHQGSKGDLKALVVALVCGHPLSLPQVIFLLLCSSSWIIW